MPGGRSFFFLLFSHPPIEINSPGFLCAASHFEPLPSLGIAPFFSLLFVSLAGVVGFPQADQRAGPLSSPPFSPFPVKQPEQLLLLSHTPSRAQTFFTGRPPRQDLERYDVRTREPLKKSHRAKQNTCPHPLLKRNPREAKNPPEQRKTFQNKPHKILLFFFCLLFLFFVFFLFFFFFFFLFFFFSTNKTYV